MRPGSAAQRCTLLRVRDTSAFTSSLPGLTRSRSPDAARQAAEAADCAADPGATLFVCFILAESKHASRLCGAALHAASRPGHERVHFIITGLDAISFPGCCATGRDSGLVRC